MNKMKLLIGSAAIFFLNACQSSTNQGAEERLFPQGNKIESGNFTGSVYLQELVKADSMNQTAVGSVTFEPGARTRWHAHPAGQILIATGGKGYYQEKGSPLRVLRRGDVVKCLPQIPHWHGASIDSPFVQVAITGREKGEVVWMDLVTDEEYSKGK